MWQDKLKKANVNIHVIATGAGAGVQQKLWEIPGSSSYLSGCSFPYSQDEQSELLGFIPEHFCSEEAAIDLASAAYMKAYKFGGKKPVGIGLTASVASEKPHRGDHRVFICVMTNDKILSFNHVFERGSGSSSRLTDGHYCDFFATSLLLEALSSQEPTLIKEAVDTTNLAMQRFMVHPYFTSNGKRLEKLSKEERFALMPGAFNPPHEGHLGAVKSAMDEYKYKAIFEVSTDPLHKDILSVQDLLQRAKLLQGHDRIFTTKMSLYIDKARTFPGKPIILGADAMIRMLDHKWGVDVGSMLEEFYNLETKLFIVGREVDGKFITCDDILDTINSTLSFNSWTNARIIMKPLSGEWSVSSTEIRNKSL